MNDDISNLVAEASTDLVQTRHFLHENPELSDHEERTAAFVADRLREIGLVVRSGVGGYGLIAEIEGSGPGRTLAIRADMDALPIEETSDKPYCSRNPGVMHACGHDGHMAMALGAVRTLAALRDSISGTVRFMFQPSEETVGGAKRMCDEGAMDGVDAIVALHGWPHLKVGQIGIRSGAMMASADTFDITIQGVGGHAAYPHLCVDPIVIGSQVVSALQTIASREIDPNDPVVVTVTQFHAGTAYNVIPGTARLMGTYRALNGATREGLPDQIRRVAENVCAASRATCQVSLREGTAPVINHPEITALISRVATETLGSENVIALASSSMGAEDFAGYLDHAPGAMFRLGLGNVSPLHTPTFDFNDRAIPIGVELFVRIALRYFE